jgi:GTP-dependent phosphoenolpyruvate carboxykinase
LLRVDAAEWVEAIAGQDDFMKPYGSRMPKSMWNQHNELARRIQDAAGLTVNL